MYKYRYINEKDIDSTIICMTTYCLLQQGWEDIHFHFNFSGLFCEFFRPSVLYDYLVSGLICLASFSFSTIWKAFFTNSPHILANAHPFSKSDTAVMLNVYNMFVATTNRCAFIKRRAHTYAHSVEEEIQVYFSKT